MNIALSQAPRRRLKKGPNWQSQLKLAVYLDFGSRLHSPLDTANFLGLN